MQAVNETVICVPWPIPECGPRRPRTHRVFRRPLGFRPALELLAAPIPSRDGLWRRLRHWHGSMSERLARKTPWCDRATAHGGRYVGGTAPASSFRLAFVSEFSSGRLQPPNHGDGPRAHKRTEELAGDVSPARPVASPRPTCLPLPPPPSPRSRRTCPHTRSSSLTTSFSGLEAATRSRNCGTPPLTWASGSE